MIRLIEENYISLENLFKKYRVKRFEIFGSALTGQGFDAENSDLDFLVEFLPLQPGKHAHAYFGFLEVLQDLCRCSIDLVETKAIRNPYFLESINQNRKEIYAA